MMKTKKKLILGIAMCGCILFGGCNTSDKSVSEIQPETEQETNDFESEEIQVEVETEFTYGEMNEDFYLVIEDVFALIDRNDVVIVGVNHNSPLYVNTDVDVLSGDERIETRVGGIEIYGATGDAVPEETNVGVLLEGLTKEDIQVGDIIVLRGCNKVLEEEIELDAPYALAYYEFLKEYARDSTHVKNGHARFGLIFIDDNEVPELLLMEDNSHASEVKVYTYDQDGVAELGEFGSSGQMQYLERGGMVFSGFTGMGEAYSSFFKVEDGQANLICNMHSWPDYSNEVYTEFYEIDGVSVEQDAFHAKWEELYGDQEFIVVGYEDGIPIEEAELKSSLAKAIDDLR